jgi:hypothetical protein
MQLEAVWNLLLQADSEGPVPHLLCSFVAHVHLLILEVSQHSFSLITGRNEV